MCGCGCDLASMGVTESGFALVGPARSHETSAAQDVTETDQFRLDRSQGDGIPAASGDETKETCNGDCGHCGEISQGVLEALAL